MFHSYFERKTEKVVAFKIIQSYSKLPIKQITKDQN